MHSVTSYLYSVAAYVYIQSHLIFIQSFSLFSLTYHKGGHLAVQTYKSAENRKFIVENTQKWKTL